MAHPLAQLPGYNLPLNAGIGKDMFNNALTEQKSTMPMTTSREIHMMQFINRVTDKPNWHAKIFDETITAKWKEEALKTPMVNMTPAMVEWCIAELRFKSKGYEQKQGVSVFNGDVVKSDNTVPESVRLALIEAARLLEDVPPGEQDWHPHSDGQVLDLVHPSLFPLVYGRSRILPEGKVKLESCLEKIGEGETIPVPKLPDAPLGYRGHRNPFSTRFQWLPCDVNIYDIDYPQIMSYINNLHPEKHTVLYDIVEQLIQYSIPLWSRTLAPQNNEDKDTAQASTLRIPYTCVSTGPRLNRPSRPKKLAAEEATIIVDDDEGKEWEDEEWESANDDGPDTDEEDEDYIFGPVILPDAGRFSAPSAEVMDLREKFSTRGLQVIVKLANIILTPEKPEYPGGSWHVEGQINEHICATSLYYYDNHNVTPSHLAFRQRVDPEETFEMGYEQNHYSWLSAVFGVENNGTAVQNIGQVETRQGRLLTFPNILQHQVQPFRLVDPNKPGHRKIIALFLVDPNIRVISTANVPPQRADWRGEEVQRQEQALDKADDFPLTMEEAKGLRLELMAERSAFVELQNEMFTAEQFSLCEH